MSIYYAREKSLHDQANLVNSAEKRGKQQGMLKEKFSIAKKLLMDMKYKFFGIMAGIERKVKMSGNLYREK